MHVLLVGGLAFSSFLRWFMASSPKKAVCEEHRPKMSRLHALNEVARMHGLMLRVPARALLKDLP